MKVQNKGGQNIIEYILITIAVVTVAFAFLSTKGKFAGAVNNVLKAPMSEIKQLNKTINFVQAP